MVIRKFSFANLNLPNYNLLNHRKSYFQLFSAFAAASDSRAAPPVASNANGAGEFQLFYLF